MENPAGGNNQARQRDYPRGRVAGGLRAKGHPRQPREGTGRLPRPRGGHALLHLLTPPLDYGDYFDLGLTPPDTTKTPSEAPTTIPEIEFITAVIRELGFRFRDTGARRWALPHGVNGIEFVWRLMDARPDHISALTNVEILSSGPFTLTFDEEKRGQRVFYAARWLGPKKQPGPWSDIESAVIP